jgi:acyl-CoA thioesterase I
LNRDERKKNTPLALGLVAIIAMSCLATVNLAMNSIPSPIRVACVGDSITYGGYPVSLQNMLGYAYEVKNFGVCGATVSQNSTVPYMSQPEFEEALEFEPDIVVVMLGTNDANPKIAYNEENFASDYTQLIQSFKSLQGLQKIWLVRSPPIFTTESAYNNTYLSVTVIPQIDALADQLKLPTIDVNSACVYYSEYFSDGIHPNNEGSTLIAENVYEAITSPIEFTDDFLYFENP